MRAAQSGSHEDVDEGVVLVTAFGPFPGQRTNPTELIADDFAGEDHVVSHVLDVSYTRATAQLDELVRMLDPVAVICFGVAAGADSVRVERLAWNVNDAPGPDVDGDVRRGRLIDHRAETLRTRLPVEQILDALAAAGVKARASDDPGRYVCNHVFRHVLTSSQMAGRPVGFVHVPPPTASGFNPAMLTLTGRVVVDTVSAVAAGRI
jgi:pyroglutamyl-peptidase